MSRVWFKQDTTFNLPKSILSFYIMSAVSMSTPDCENMSGLFVGWWILILKFKIKLIDNNFVILDNSNE